MAWFWTLLPLVGGALLVPWGADWPHSVALVTLWLMGGLSLGVFGIVYGALAYAPKVVAWTPRDASWTARRGGLGLGRWVHWTAFSLGLVVAPLVAGHPMLAGCFAIAELLMFGMPDIGGEDAERDPARPRRVGKAVFWILFRLMQLAGWCISIVAQAIFMIVLWIAETIDAPFELRRKRRLARRLRSTFDAPGGAVYFAYSEPHQFDRFLGAGGVLQAAIGGVIARNWRNDIQPGWSTRSKTPLADAERELLHR